MVCMTTKAKIAAIVAANVRAEIAAEGMTIKALGELLGLGVRAASERWHGRVPYTIDDLVILADHFGVSMDMLATPRSQWEVSVRVRTPALAS